MVIVVNTVIYSEFCKNSELLLKDYKCSHHKEVINIQGDGYYNYPELIIPQCIDVSKHPHCTPEIMHLLFIN
jgi:hypothetical protein